MVIDASNRMGEPEVNSRAAVVAAAPQASYVRAFNTLGWENFADPLPGTALFFAADPAGRQAVPPKPSPHRTKELVMARFMDFHEDLKLPAEAIAQIADDTRNARADQFGVRQIEL